MGGWRSRAIEPDDDEADPSTSAGQSALEHFGNTMTLGYLPHLQAMAGGLVEGALDPTMKLDHDLKKQGFDIQEKESSYLDRRDENLKRLEKEGEEHPIASGVGTGLGILGSAAIPVGVAAKGATLGAKALAGAKTGALMGGLANPGDTENEINPLQVGGRLQNAAIGGAIGGALPVGFDKASKASAKVSAYLKDKAERKAFRSLGRQPMTQRMKDFIKRGKHVEMGRELLDDNAIPFFGTTDRIKSRVSNLKEQAGKAIGNAIDDVDAGRKQYTPITIKNPKKPVKVQDEVRMTPIRFDENPAKRIGNNLRPEDAPPILVKGDEQTIQHAMFEKPRPKVVAGKVKDVPLFEVDSNDIADELLKSPEMALLKKTPGMEATAAQLEKQVETLRTNGKMTARQAHDLRRAIDKSINFNKTVPGMSGASKGLHVQRGALNDAIADMVERSPTGNGKAALQRNNRKYSTYSMADDLLENEMSREQANRAISLTDTIMTAAGASSGNPALAIGLGALNKGVRTFGNSMQARVYDAIAKKAAGAAPALAKANSGAVSAAVNRGATEYRNDFDKDSDPILNNDRLMKLFIEDPSLIEKISDEETKSKVKRAIAGGKGR